MLLKPIYGPDPVLRLDGDPAAICEPLVRQNRRLGELLATLSDEQWGHATRCDAWTVRDIIVHLGITNQFWSASVSAGLAGTPTEMLATFDPAASPLEMGANNVESPAEVLAKFLEVSNGWCSQVEALSGDDWQALAEAPPGHVGVSAVLHHALWDSWIHERDIALPLGLTPVVEADEVRASLRYAIGLGSTLKISHGEACDAAATFVVANPADTFTLTVSDFAQISSGASPGAPVLEADAVPLLEGVSMRAAVPIEPGDDVAWIFDGLKQAFDQ